MTILIVDDDRLSRRFLKEILCADPQNRVVEAENGTEALKVLQLNLPPDMCILDNKMPGMDGIEVLEKIREDSRLASLPVMMLTSCSDVSSVTKAARLRVSYYILKPFDPKLVRAQVAKVQSELMTRSPLQNPDQVCARLGISREVYRQRATQLVAKLQLAISNICVALTSGKPAVAMQESSEMKPLCQELGAVLVTVTLSKLEAALRHDQLMLSTPATGEEYNVSSDRFKRLQELMTVLDRVLSLIHI
eukprot:TRINITY_DN23416_c0_g1_i1.p2 TRINITY_DN23416_c0_g1~~TRINITY_DN23416_c0_g1_i1.p2  ORF type:complete len:249 (+),score=27.07 TRINITY_DN23416_c0_g1_i1:742-1488(+)